MQKPFAMKHSNKMLLSIPLYDLNKQSFTVLVNKQLKMQQDKSKQKSFFTHCMLNKSSFFQFFWLLQKILTFANLTYGRFKIYF